MADICIFYDSHDRRAAKALVDFLSRQYDVWWDQKIGLGDFRAEIENQLSKSRCVLVVWSAVSRKNQFVIDEASMAADAKVPILHVLIERVRPALGFGSQQRVELAGWTGDPAHVGVAKLSKYLSEVISKHPSRERTLLPGVRDLPMPILFHSVSSHETQLRPADALRILELFRAEAVLASTYDTAPEDAVSSRKPATVVKALLGAQRGGSLILLDSGNYEASRRADGTWTRDRHHIALQRTPHDLAFCFDDLDPPRGVEGVVRQVLNAVAGDSKHTKAPVLPIVHAPRNNDGRYDLRALPKALATIARELRPPLLAIPERELGDGLLARAATVRQIRMALNGLGFYQRLHLLGTGNPMSVAVLAAAGADSFDGLEWCRVTADAESGTLHHFHQYDFFAYQARVANSQTTQDAASSERVGFPAKVLLHNLDFFSGWMNDLRRSIAAGTVAQFLVEKLPKGMRQELHRFLPATP